MLEDWSPTWETHPHTTSSTTSGSMPARSNNSLSTTADRSAACMPDNPPLRLPTAVRTASTITVSRISGFSCPVRPRAGVGRSYRAPLAQRGNLVVAEAQISEDRVGVLPQAGNGAHRGFVSGDDRRWQQRGDRAVGRIDLSPPVARGQLREHQHFARRVVARVADTGGIRGLLDMRQVVLCAPGRDRLVEDVAVRDPSWVGPEPLVVGQVGALQDVSGQSLPFAVVGGAQYHGLPV